MMIEERLQRGTTQTDVFSYLQKPDEVTGTKLTKLQISANVDLLIIAGSGMSCLPLPLPHVFFHQYL
jgi:hypothetical protein